MQVESFTKSSSVGCLNETWVEKYLVVATERKTSDFAALSFCYDAARPNVAQIALIALTL